MSKRKAKAKANTPFVPVPVKTESALAAVKDLRGCDHGFLSAAGVKRFNDAFGLGDAIKPYRARANPRDPKGLTFDNGSDSGVGFDAADYAERASDLLGTGFRPWQMGRGFRLRSACDAIEAHFRRQCSEYYHVPSPFGGQRQGPRCNHPAGHPGAHWFPGIDDKDAQA